ncbi:hypothetical protein OS175_13230 [Marinicella sp. S1101]|uniref:chorismate transformation enzyme, FkbO/Hyg5 family n=1 Tax=Marinicella marina TaxID=2996016 RepID=UPI002260995E|nr:hypothetical protein [Marinicella marina]MCX7554836.1 hypothetical protein [Marinicella marina]MDJ1140931.1 hypothetical protein [Marinicella marina]
MKPESSTKSQNQLHVGLTSNRDVLLVVDASTEAPSGDSTDAIQALMPLEKLACSNNYMEYWFDASKVNRVVANAPLPVQITQSAQHLVISCDVADQDLASTTHEVYHHAYTLSQELGYPNLLRTWNYLNDIHGKTNGMERYQGFCVARHEVMEKLDQLQQPNPAATAIGCHNGRHSFVFLFSQAPGQVIENKRQISAWEYPKKYAPKQPRFSRAMLYGDLLMCSGTASVVGHETKHLNDLSAQFHECLTNIQALMDEGGIKQAISSGMFRFYLRNGHDLQLVIDHLQQRNIDSFVILEGDICREDLLIECEAVFQKE